MANLHRYGARIQQRRTISIDALNAQHAKALAEADVESEGDVVDVQALGATKTADSVGVENGQPLHRYDVDTRLRRDISMDAEDQQSALLYAIDDANTSDTVSIGGQGVANLHRQNVGVA